MLHTSSRHFLMIFYALRIESMARFINVNDYTEVFPWSAATHVYILT